MRMTNGFKISQLESQMRDKEKLLKSLLPTKTPGDKKLFKQTQQEIKLLFEQVNKLRKGDTPKRIFKVHI